MKKGNRFHWVYCCRNNQELAESYDQWAKEYDNDVKQNFAWCGPQYTAEFFVRYVPKEAEILDAGAGTGLVSVWNASAVSKPGGATIVQFVQ